MSASSKKKLRRAEDASKLTERQKAQQKEAKKLKLYTAAFVALMAVILVTALTVGISRTVANSGIQERKTVAMTVGDQKISSAEMSYFFTDYCRSFYSQNSYFLQMFMDPTAPLDSQLYDAEAGTTWADFMLTSVQEKVRSTYALYMAAEAAGYTLTEEDEASIESTMSMQQLYTLYSGFSDVEDYLKAAYGPGSTEESYREYLRVTTLADSYYNAYGDSLSYDDAALRAVEEGNYDNYSSFTYYSYTLSVSRFLTGGTTGEDGTVTYSDEEQAAARAEAAAAADTLTDPETITSPEALNNAISALSINQSASTPVTSTENTSRLYTSIDSDVAQWLAGDRKEGDLTAIPKKAEVDGAQVIESYTIVWFVSRNDNNAPTSTVRHILVKVDESATAEEKAAALAKAEDILKQWKSGEATEDSFALLATEMSEDTGSASTGGLIADINPGSSYVKPFLNWSVDSSRKVGDTGIVETDYGYHVMYFCSHSEQSYRDILITNELRTADLDAWYNGLLETCPATPGVSKYLPLDMTLS